LDQHFARRRAALADIFMRGADAAAAAGRHVAPYPLARQIRAGRREFGLDLRPVALKLLGHELGETGLGALAHFRAGDADDDGVVGPDHHPGVDLGRAVLSAHHRGPERNLEPEREAAADRGSADHESTAVHSWHMCHGCLPYAVAAA